MIAASYPSAFIRNPDPSEGFPRLAYLDPWARVGMGGGRISRIVGVPRVSRGPMGTGPWAQNSGGHNFEKIIARSHAKVKTQNHQKRT